MERVRVDGASNQKNKDKYIEDFNRARSFYNTAKALNKNRSRHSNESGLLSIRKPSS